MKKFYDGFPLLNKLDIKGNKPEIYICTSNRSAGKTTFFSKYLVDQFKKYREKFGLLYRYNYELDDVADKFFKDISGLFFPKNFLESKRRASGIFHELFLDGASCGYAISINSVDQLKKYSHLFSDIKHIMFDEFQTESQRYCSDEIKKFISVHTTIARGQGKQVRYVPIYMVGNPVSILNPYYLELGITERLRSDTKFLRGDGYVLEQGFNLSASKAMDSSGFNRAFAKNEYLAYSKEGVYLFDDKAFIDKPEGRCYYIMTIRYNNNEYGVLEYPDLGLMYVSNKPDKTCKLKVTVNYTDHDVNFIMLRQNSYILDNFRTYFEQGCFRFKNQQCKEALIKVLALRLKL